METDDEKLAQKLAGLSAWQKDAAAEGPWTILEDAKRHAKQAAKSDDQAKTAYEAGLAYGRLRIELNDLRELCRESARALGQVASLANVNPATRRILVEIGNRLNAAARSKKETAD